MLIGRLFVGLMVSVGLRIMGWFGGILPIDLLSGVRGLCFRWWFSWVWFRYGCVECFVVVVGLFVLA